MKLEDLSKDTMERVDTLCSVVDKDKDDILYILECYLNYNTKYTDDEVSGILNNGVTNFCNMMLDLIEKDKDLNQEDGAEHNVVITSLQGIYKKTLDRLGPKEWFMVLNPSTETLEAINDDYEIIEALWQELWSVLVQDPDLRENFLEMNEKMKEHQFDYKELVNAISINRSTLFILTIMVYNMLKFTLREPDLKKDETANQHVTDTIKYMLLASFHFRDIMPMFKKISYVTRDFNVLGVPFYVSGQDIKEDKLYGSFGNPRFVKNYGKYLINLKQGGSDVFTYDIGIMTYITLADKDVVNIGTSTYKVDNDLNMALGTIKNEIGKHVPNNYMPLYEYLDMNVNRGAKIRDVLTLLSLQPETLEQVQVINNMLLAPMGEYELLYGTSIKNITIEQNMFCIDKV